MSTPAELLTHAASRASDAARHAEGRSASALAHTKVMALDAQVLIQAALRQLNQTTYPTKD